jgi:hypothetical protein
MNTIRLMLAFGIALGVLTPAKSENGSSVSFLLKPEPASGATSVSITRDFGDEELAHKFPKTVPVAFTGPHERTMLSVTWSDNSSSQFPVHLFVGLGSRPIYIGFFRDPPDEESTTKCAGLSTTTPSTIENMFRMFFVCRKAAIVVEKRGDTWTHAHVSALDGWFRANYALYQRGKPLSPYGFDTDLLQRLKEAVSSGYPEGKYSPLRFTDARKAIKEVDEEDIRAAGLIPAAVKNGQLDAARAINTRASKRLEELTGETGSSNIQGVTRDVLEGNASYLSTLGGSPAGSPAGIVQ